jgi:hypothetical protein
MSHAWSIPLGDEIVVEVDDELMPMQPTSIAFGVTVVGAVTDAERPEAPKAEVVGASRPLAPEYRATPAPLVTADVSVHR